MHERLISLTVNPTLTDDEIEQLKHDVRIAQQLLKAALEAAAIEGLQIQPRVQEVHNIKTARRGIKTHHALDFDFKIESRLKVRALR